MERWTRWIARHRWPVLAAWLLVLLAGGYSSSKLPDLLSNTFTMPGTDSERARTILEEHYGDRSDGAFTVVFRVPDADDAALRARLQAAVARGATKVPSGRARPLVRAGSHVLYGDIVSTLELAKAKGYTDDILREASHGGLLYSYVTGQAAIQHDLDPVFDEDLQKGEFEIAIPIALAVLLLVFGLSWSVTIPLLFAACTIMGTLGAVYLIAHGFTMATYVTNLVQLIGLGIAIDYSLLVVYRFREELMSTESKDEAIVRTMSTAGRAVVFSGATVAIGLALLLFMPLPFMQSMGIGGFLIPLTSIVAATTLQPVLLSVFGRRGIRRVHVADFLRDRLHVPLPRLPGTADPELGLWARLARSIMRAPVAYLAVGATALVAAAVPVFDLELTPGSASGTPQSPESIRGFNVLRGAVGPGALGPTQIVVRPGRGGSLLDADHRAATAELVARLKRDPEVARVEFAPHPPYVLPDGRYGFVSVAGRHEYGEREAQRFARRLRGEILPSVRFPEGTRVLAGGGPPQGIDFLDRSYDAFPWLVLAVLVLTYLTLMRAFRSLLLPLKAVLLNLLAIGATYGLLVIVFKYGVGADLFGLYQFDQVEGWIPIFLFAMLFGLSMDYEVFLVTRMREFWDEGRSNEEAVAQGLERTGRIVTAAAIIMCAAFCGFAAGSIVGLQEFGLGLAIAIFLDATLIRAILVPALMALFGRWNWWLPAGVASLVRVAPSPLQDREPRPAVRPAG